MNLLEDVIPQILAQGLMALRENVVMPALVNSSYGTDAAEQGATIDVPIPSAVAARDVAPAAVPPTTPGVNPTKAVITLDQWKEAPFFLTDKDMREAMNGTIPMQASEAVKAIANVVNNYLFGFYKGVYGFHGTPGTTPFANGTEDATEVRKILNKQLALLTDRRLVMDPDAEAKALNLRAFQDMSFSGSAAAIVEGRINTKLGFDWFMDQLVPTHIAGSATGYVVSGATAAGAKTAAVTTGTALANVGDIFTVAGDTQTYTVTEVTGGPNMSAISFAPGVQLAGGWADTDAITFVNTDHVVNLGFHRDAFAFANRPLAGENVNGLGSLISSIADPISGLSMRLEITRQHKRLHWSYDMLYGGQLVRPDLAVRLAG